MFFWITVALVLTACEARPCDIDDFNSWFSCSAAWGYTTGFQPHPDMTVWDMDVFTQYCRSSNRELYSGCVHRVFSRCQWPGYPEQVVYFSRMANMTEAALSHMCSNIEVIEAHRGCIDAADSQLTRCSIDTLNRMNSELMEIGLYGEELTWADVQPIDKRRTLSIMNCVYGVLRNKCNKDVALLFKNFHYAAYAAFEDE